MGLIHQKQIGGTALIFMGSLLTLVFGVLNLVVAVPLAKDFVEKKLVEKNVG